jgi:hypothetical protein
MDKIRDCDLYKIEVEGILDPSWSEWFGGLAMAPESESQNLPTTVLTGRISDQAYLRGVLCKIWDLNFKVISVERVGRPDEGLENHE